MTMCLYNLLRHSPKVDIKGQGEILAPLSGVALSPHELVKILFRTALP